MTYHCQMGLILCLLVPAGFSCIIVPTGRASLLLLLIGFSLQLLPHQRSGYLPNIAAAFVHQLLGHNTRHEAEQLSLLKASMTFDAMALASCGSACQ